MKLKLRGTLGVEVCGPALQARRSAHQLLVIVEPRPPPFLMERGLPAHHRLQAYQNFELAGGTKIELHRGFAQG
ncbi:MAG: hypothetical protein OSA97_02835 [Nevskia sp.]|nr:hypothetical protein [Nevskia sp.]